jgi:electron transfer flavoprotein alpha subunit
MRLGERRGREVATPVAGAMADGQILQVTAAAFALGADVFQRRVFRGDMQTTHPAGHLPMQLARNGVVNLGSGE